MDLTKRITASCNQLYEKCEALVQILKKVPQENLSAAQYFGDVVVSQMEDMHRDADLLEKLTAKSYWPYPTYSDILYY